VSVDYLSGGIDHRVADTLNKALTRLAHDYPETFHKMKNVVTLPIAKVREFYPTAPNDLYGFSVVEGRPIPNEFMHRMPPGIYLIAEKLKDPSILQRIGRKHEASGYWAPGTGSVTGLFFHEFGHHIGGRIVLNPTLQTAIEQSIEHSTGRTMLVVAADHGRLGAQHVEQLLSGYAARNPSEMIAEAFAEWKLSPQPRALASAIGSVIDRFLKGELGANG
jgi:hypothetical protein